MKYMVLVDDNFHYMDESERYTHGEYDSAEDAIAECKKMVDEFLTENYKDGISADDLYSYYKGFGEDPFIGSDDTECKFSAWNYAKERCREMCSEQAT